MRSISAGDDAVLRATGGRYVRHRVKVKNAGGSFVDLSEYPGQNLCLEANWGEDVDSPGMDADIVLKREVCDLSLAPLKSASPLNRAFVWPGTYSPLIAAAREVQIDVAVLPEGSAPLSGDWHLAFHGYIDEIDPGAGSHITLRCSDLQAKLRDTFIERERCYSFAQGVEATKGCNIWRPFDPAPVGTRGVPTEALRNGHFYRVTAVTTGFTGAVEPTWPTGAGATVVDGGVTWTESGLTSVITGNAVETIMQQILDDNLGAGVVTLEVPASPGWLIKFFKQQRQSVWDALRGLADQIGWDLRYKWHAASSSFRLTFYAPDRAKTVPDREITAAQRYPLRRLQTSVAWVRNVVRVIFSNSGALDTAGNRQRTVIERTDATSIAAYGRRFCEVEEDKASQIDTQAEAEALADALLSDLANPVAEQECEVPLFRHVELGDLIRWSSNGIHFDSAQDLAVSRYRHSVNVTRASTSIQTRGKPSAGFERWNGMIDGEAHSLDLGNANLVNVTLSGTVGGVNVNVARSGVPSNALAAAFEVHVSDTPAFTPSTATLVAQGDSGQTSVSNLIPGETYYAKVIPYGYNASKIVRGQPSAEVSFVAGYAEPGHLDPEKFRGELPPNGSFESALRSLASYPPDHWDIVTGTWRDDIDPDSDAGDTFDGVRSIVFKPTAVAAKLRSAYFPVSGSSLYAFSAWLKKFGTPDGTKFAGFDVEWYDSAKASISTSAHTVQLSATSGWFSVRKVFAAPSTACYATIAIKKTTADSHAFWVDAVSLRFIGADWTNVSAFGGTWVQDTTQVSYRFDANGEIVLKGSVKSGTLGTAALTLPVAPAQMMRFCAIGGFNTQVELQVDTSGNVIPAAGTNSWVSLDCVRFTPS